MTSVIWFPLYFLVIILSVNMFPLCFVSYIFLVFFSFHTFSIFSRLKFCELKRLRNLKIITGGYSTFGCESASVKVILINIKSNIGFTSIWERACEFRDCSTYLSFRIILFGVSHNNDECDYCVRGRKRSRRTLWPSDQGTWRECCGKPRVGFKF